MIQNEELQKLLDSTVTPLQPQDLEPKLVETIYKLAPAWSFFNQATAESKVHEFNQRIGLPVANFEGEMAITPSSSSQYYRQSVTLKIIRVKNGVTNVAQLSMQRFIDALKTELMGTTRSMGWQIEAGVLWGNASADPYQFDGIDNLVASNVIDWGAPVSLALLDQMIDASDDAGGEGHPRAFILGNKIKSSLTRILRNQYHAPELMEVREGLVVPAYRGIPLLSSTGVRAFNAMGSVAGTPASGGSLVNGNTYYWAVAPVTVDGEQQASAPISATMSSPNLKQGLSWTAYVSPKGAPAFLYKIYRGATAATMYQIDTVAGFTYAANGTQSGNVTSYVDDGSNTGNVNRLPLASGDQVIFLLDSDPDESCEIRYLSERNSIIMYLDIAQTSDQREFLMRSFLALVMKYEAVNAIARRVSAV